MKELATVQQVFPSIPEAMEARPSGKADILEMDGMPQQALQAMLEKIEDAWWDRDIRHNLYRNHATTRTSGCVMSPIMILITSN